MFEDYFEDLRQIGLIFKPLYANDETEEVVENFLFHFVECSAQREWFWVQTGLRRENVNISVTLGNCATFTLRISFLSSGATFRAAKPKRTDSDYLMWGLLVVHSTTCFGVFLRGILLGFCITVELQKSSFWLRISVVASRSPGDTVRVLYYRRAAEIIFLTENFSCG